MILFLLIHLLVSVSILYVGKNKLNRQERFSNLLLALFFPVGGYVIVLMLYLTWSKRTKRIIDYDDIEDNLMLFTDRLNRERDTNVVSLEETLFINETKVKRHQMLEVLKKDFRKYIDMLRIALRDEDIETSHYAASAIDEIKRDLDLRLQILSVEYEKNKYDDELLEQYADMLEEYLNSGLLNEYDYRKIAFTYTQVLENLLKIRVDKGDYYYRLVTILFKMGELQELKELCKNFLKEYESENAYLVNLKYYYLMKDKGNFDMVLKRLKESSIKLSDRGLNIIRLWTDGVENE